MTPEFNKEDIEPLDFIINETLIKPIVQTDDLIKAGFIKPSNDDGFEIDAGYNPVREFVRYLYILDQLKVCDCYDTADGEFARANAKTLHFKKQGGFKKMYDDRINESVLVNKKNELEIKNLELQKENLEYQKSIRDLENQIRNLNRDNLRLGNWDIRFRWLIAIITFIIGFIVKYFIDK